MTLSLELRSPARLLSLAAVLGASLLCCQTALAQTTAPQPPEDQPPTRRLTLYPAAEPRPALKYQLLPGLLDRKPGNAAVLYNKIGLMFRGGPEFTAEQEKVSQWGDDSLPLEKFPREDARTIVEHWRQVLDDLEYASRRETCDWELPFRERNPITMSLPDAQESRAYARLLRLQARLQVADGDLAGAIASLRTGYALARHVAQGETFVNALIGMAICGHMNAQLEELVSQPGAPNMYWAVASLPHPFIGLRVSTEAEHSFVYLMYPELRDIESQRHPPEYWSRLLDKLATDVAGWNDDAWKDYSKLSLAARTAQRYPEAKRRLIESGRSPEEVAAMPVAQVVLLYTMQIYDESRDDLFKWFALPYPEAKAGFDKFQADWTEVRDREIVPLFSVLAPATGAVANASARHERSFAMLRTIEALRMYAAAHDGRGPKQLEDITEVPVPSDPLTGNSFIYRADGDAAVLEAPLPGGMEQRHYGLRYEITFAR
ncbi:MAG TPA: hypothetical protein VHB99_03690 [Pirellulales bacterium]|nr:hypothetical protein [Pirellulales bacterium]